VNDLAQRFARSPVLGVLSEDRRRELARAAIRRRVAKGRRLFSRGDPGDTLLVVLTGRIDVVYAAENGEITILRTLGPDAVLGLSTALGAKHSSDLVAKDDALVAFIPGAALRKLFKSDPDLAIQTVLHLAELVATLTEELADLLVRDLEERVRRRLIRIGRGRREISITHHELAAQVGATRANVSRALARLETKKELKRRRGRIELL
jgi:CRP/FNR family transcriptional regulator, cyclic AMP receptor protein